MENSNAEIRPDALQARLDELKARRDECQVKVSAIRARIEDHRKSLEAARERVNGVMKEIAAAEVPGPDLKKQLNKFREDAVFFEAVLGELEGTLLPKAEEELKAVTAGLEDACINVMKPRQERAIDEFKRLAGLMEDVKKKWDKELLGFPRELGIPALKVHSLLSVIWNVHLPLSFADINLVAAAMKKQKQ